MLKDTLSSRARAKPDEGSSDVTKNGNREDSSAKAFGMTARGRCYFSMQCPQRVLFVSEKFSNFVMLFLGIADISKVFFAVLNRKSDSFHKAKGLTNSTHFLYSYVAMHFLCIYSILSKCGAVYRLFLLGFCQSLRLNKRKSTPHFLFYTNPPHRSCYGKTNCL